MHFLLLHVVNYRQERDLFKLEDSHEKNSGSKLEIEDIDLDKEAKQPEDRIW